MRSLADLARADWLNLLPANSLEEAFSSVGLAPPKPIIQCESFNLMVALLAKTDMVGIFSQRIAALPQPYGALELIAVEPLPSYTVGIVARKEPPLTPAAATLARAITTCARRLPPIH